MKNTSKAMLLAALLAPAGAGAQTAPAAPAKQEQKPAEAAQAAPAQPEQKPAEAAQPAPAQPEQKPAEAAQPAPAQPEQKPAEAAQPATAGEPCGGFRLENGKIVTTQPIAIEPTLSEPVAACVRAIGKAAAGSPFIRGVTVEARAPAAERIGGKALGAAQRAADVLVEQGIPRQRVSIVAPRIEAGEQAGLFLTYTEAPSEKPLALIEHATGTVEAGRGEGQLAPVATGAKLPQYTTLETGDTGHATVLLADGSRLQLAPSTSVRLNALALNTALKPQVQLELLRGEVEVSATTGGDGALFEFAARGAAAQASGARFRLIAEEGQTRLEVLEGDVGFAGQQAKPKPNQAVAITRDGKALEVRAQLAPPAVVGPVLGTFQKAPALSWTAAEGAKEYRVELARDPAFRQSMRWLTVSGTSADAGELEKGKWFWRVRGIDPEGFTGLGSKIYAFTVDPDAPAETPVSPATPKVEPIPSGSAPPKA